MICPKTEKQIAEIDCCKCLFYFKETKKCIYKDWKPGLKSGKKWDKKDTKKKKQNKKEEK